MKYTNLPISIFFTFLFILILQSISSAQTNIPNVFGHSLEKRLVYISTNFIRTEQITPLKQLLHRAANQCFTGVVLSDTKFGRLNSFPEGSQYQENLIEFLDEATSLGLNVYPIVVNFGYSSSILFHDPNLAEGLPVIEAPFVVQKRSGKLVLVNDPNDQLALNNGNFEATVSKDNRIPDWDFQDEPGQLTFLDETESNMGTASFKITNLEKTSNGIGRISQKVSVSTFRDYHVSVWVKTENWEKGLVQFLAIDNGSNRQLSFNPIQVDSRQDWTKYELTFNTLESTDITIFLGVWDGGKGTIWFDDLEIIPTTFNNIIRRESTPVHIKRANGQLLKEGIDTAPIIDPLSGKDPSLGTFSIWHTQPQIEIPSSSSLMEGEKVLISYYHTAIIKNDQVCASLTEPASLDIAELQLRGIREIMIKKGIFKGWFLNYDEIRINNWDNSPNYGSPGANLAFSFQEVYRRAKNIDQNVELMTWSDMFDRYHNASREANPYYLVKGSWTESWKGLPNDVVIFNWQYRDRINSGNFFAQQGHQQILCGYYDQPSFYTRNWLEEMQGKQGIKGVLFTTWKNDYSELENWAIETWGGCSYVSSSPSINTDKSELILRPNPAQEYVQVELTGGLYISRLLLMDRSGKIVLDQKKLSSKTIQIATKSISTGIYFLIAHTNDKKISVYKKLSIQQ